MQLITKMKIKNFFFFLLFITITFSATSCLDNTDDMSSIDEEWKYMNEKRFADLPILTSENESQPGADTLFRTLYSNYDKAMYTKWRKSDSISTNSLKNTIKIAVDGKAEFTDSVIVRYEGWYYLEDGTKYLFNSTERPTHQDPTVNPNKVSVGFSVSSVLPGWIDHLTDMNVGEEREICIPWQLGYGSAGSGKIPGYTTLWFRVLLVKIEQKPK